MSIHRQKVQFVLKSALFYRTQKNIYDVNFYFGAAGTLILQHHHIVELTRLNGDCHLQGDHIPQHLQQHLYIHLFQNKMRI